VTVAVATLGPVTLHARQFLGSGYFFSDLTDWYTLPDSKAPVDPIPGAPGNFDGGEDWPAAAVFSLGGFARAGSRQEAIQMQAALNAVRSMAALTALTVADDDGPTSRLVSIQRIKWSDQKKESTVPFTIDFLAPDPFRYGTAAAVTCGLPVDGTGWQWPAVWPDDWGSGGDPGRIVTVNVGSQAAYTQLAVSGGLDGGASIINIEDGREVRLERPIPLGSTAYIDPTTGQAWLDTPSNDISGFLTVADWWQVPPNSFRTLQFNGLGTVSGTPQLTGTTAPPFL
jgi:hypothetical protein